MIPAEAVAITHGYEGLGGERSGRFHPYQGKADRQGVITIGRGRVLSEPEKKTGQIVIAGQVVQFNDGLTLAQVDALYTQDMAPRLKRTQGYMPNAKPHELGAGLSLVYNIEAAMATGTPGRAWRAGDKMRCAAGFLLYVASNGVPQLGLWRRRMTEALCLLTGEVIIAKEPANEKKLYDFLSKLGVIKIAADMAKAQKLNIPWLKG